jgi:hypothetical protein
MKLPLRHLQINPQGNEFADDHPDYPKGAGRNYERDYDAILDADGEIVADNAGYYPTGIDRDAAAHIVKCVNVHDQMLITIGKLASGMKRGDEGWSKLDEEVYQLAMEAPHA